MPHIQDSKFAGKSQAKEIALNQIWVLIRTAFCTCASKRKQNDELGSGICMSALCFQGFSIWNWDSFPQMCVTLVFNTDIPNSTAEFVFIPSIGTVIDTVTELPFMDFHIRTADEKFWKKF